MGPPRMPPPAPPIPFRPSLPRDESGKYRRMTKAEEATKNLWRLQEWSGRNAEHRTIPEPRAARVLAAAWWHFPK